MMMSELEKTQLNAAAVEVFGMMYYTPVELLPELPGQDKWRLEAQYVKTAIDYSGPRGATLCFHFPRSLAVSIAGGFLGIVEEKVADSQLLDTMREAANMIVGNLLGRIDAAGVCTLGIPQAEIVQGYSPETLLQQGETMAFVSDFGLLWLHYQQKSAAQR
jgi:hypothetical protein